MRRFAGLAAVVGALALAGPAVAITPTIDEFSSGLPSSADPFDIAAGPDAGVWFTDGGGTGALGRATTAGAIAEFHTGLHAGSHPFNIAPGPDGNLWFTDSGVIPAIGRVSTSGAITEFNLGGAASPSGIAQGPDGNLWFTDDGATPAIGRITTNGAIQEFPLAHGSTPIGIAAGPDGALWFADSGTPAIGRITTAGDINLFTSGLNPGSKPADITAGPDGNLWFSDEGTTSAIGRVTTAGAIDEFTSGLNGGSFPVGITAGADGALWFADQGSPPAIGRITTAGSADEFSVGLNPGSNPSGIGAGPDGNVWFTDVGSTPAIGRITTPPTARTVGASATGPNAGAVLGVANGHAQPTTVHVEYGPVGGATTATRDQNIGVTSGDTHFSVGLGGLRPRTAYQARVVATNPTGTATGDFLTFTTTAPKDRITNLRIRPRVMVAAARGGPIRAARTAGAIVSYSGTQPATTTFTVQRAVAGRRQGRLCLRPNRRNRGGAPCTRYVGVGSFKHKDRVGANRFRFTGRIRHHKLAPGGYRLVAVPRNAAGAGAARRATFKVKR